MAKGKSQYCVWNCTVCNKGNYVTAYNKKSNEKIKKEFKKFCKQCRKTTLHKRKDVRKPAAK